jgi:hypothetical protein
VRTTMIEVTGACDRGHDQALGTAPGVGNSLTNPTI